MIFENAKPRIDAAIIKAKDTFCSQEVSFIYNELLTHDGIISVFDYLFRQSIDFETRHEEYRFILIIKPNAMPG